MEASLKSQTGWVYAFTNDITIRYRFLTELICYATYMTKNNTQWSMIPGYYDLIYPVLEVMAKETPAFSKNTIALSKSLLYNIRLLNPFIRIALESTNIHNSAATITTVHLLEDWFTSYTKKHDRLHLPNYIDFDFIRSAVRILLLENEHFNVILATLIFLYK